MTAILTPGQYLAKCRTDAGLSIEDVAAGVQTEPKLAEHVRADWIRLIEADETPATINTLVGLRSQFWFDIAVVAQLTSPEHCLLTCADHCACPRPAPAPAEVAA